MPTPDYAARARMIQGFRNHSASHADWIKRRDAVFRRSQAESTPEQRQPAKFQSPGRDSTDDKAT